MDAQTAEVSIGRGQRIDDDDADLDSVPKHNLEDDPDAPLDVMQTDIDVERILQNSQRSYGSRRRIPLYEAPEFVKRLNAFEDVKAGATVNFECQWRAFPKPAIKWYQDDEEITENDRFEISADAEKGILRLCIEDARKKDEGAYKCKAENQEGVASTTGYLSVTGQVADKPLSSQPRKCTSEHAVSMAPHLRTITEQKSLEEREGTETDKQPPSPIQNFIDQAQRSKTWPFAVMGYGAEDQRDDDVESNSSDTSVESQDYDLVSFEVGHDAGDDGEDEDDSEHIESLHIAEDSDYINEDQPGVTAHRNRAQPATQHPSVTIALENDRNSLRPFASPINDKPSVTVNYEDEEQQSKSTTAFDSSSRVNDVPHSSQAYTTTDSHTQENGSAVTVGKLPLSTCKTPDIAHRNNPAAKARPRPRPRPYRNNVPAMDLSQLFDILDTPLIYYLPITAIAAFIASATEMNPAYLVIGMTLLSLFSFRILLRRPEII